MKYYIILIAFFTFSSILFSQNTDYFKFDLPIQGEISSEELDITATNTYGVSYNFDSGITAGFSIINSGDSTISTIEVGVEVGESGYITALTGSDGENFALGLGIGYDFFIKKDKLNSSVGLYLDYIATNGDKDAAPFSFENGGLFLIGLKTSLGL